ETAVLRIAHDSDDRAPAAIHADELQHFASPRDALANRIAPGKELLRQRLVEDDDERGIVAIGSRELTALDERNPRGAEVLRVGRAVLRSRHRFAGGELPALRLDLELELCRLERHRGSDADVAHSRN